VSKIQAFLNEEMKKTINCLPQCAKLHACQFKIGNIKTDYVRYVLYCFNHVVLLA